MVRFDRELMKGSLMLLVIFNAYSLINLLFQSSMARLLSVSDYGMLAALGYFVYFSGMFSEAVQTMVTRYSAVETDISKLRRVIRSIFTKVVIASLVVCTVYLLGMVVLSRLFDAIAIPFGLVVLNGFVIFVFLLLPVTRGILQGKKRFLGLGSNLISEAFVKIMVGVGLVFLGWEIYGALVGLALGVLVAFLLSLVSTRDIFSIKGGKAKQDALPLYSRSFFLVMISLFAFYSVDLFLAQLLFSKDVAGAYSIASVLSKIIFWGTQPVSRAMFPIILGRGKPDMKKHHDYANAFLLVSSGVVTCLLLFFFFPDIVITLFSGKSLPLSGAILFYLGLCMSALSYANLTVLYNISRGLVYPAFYFVILFVAGVTLMLLFRTTLLEFSFAFLVASCGFLLASMYLPRTP